MRLNKMGLLTVCAAVVLATGLMATVAQAAPRNAASKSRGQDFSFWQRDAARSYRAYRAPMRVEATPAPVVVQTPAPAANNNAAQAPSTGERRFSTEPAQNVERSTNYNNYYFRPRNYGSSSRGNFSAGRKSLGTYLP